MTGFQVWLLIGSIVLLVLCMGLLAVVVYLMSKGVNRLSSDISDFLHETQTELVPALRDLRQVLTEAEYLTAEVKDKVQRFDGVLNHVEGVLDGKVLAAVAHKAVTGSRVTVASILEGIKQGIKTFRSAEPNKREET